MIKPRDYMHDAFRLIPEAREGNISILKDVLPKGALLRMYFPGGFFYTEKLSSHYPFIKITENTSRVWMSDTPSEQDQLVVPVILAHSRVLMIGLGLGLFILMTRKRNKSVESITVIEKDATIADLVYPHVCDHRTRLIVEDGETYLNHTTERFDFIYTDIWDNTITTIKEIDKWNGMAQRCLSPYGTAMCWLQVLYDRVKDKIPKEPVPNSGKIEFLKPCLTCGKVLRSDYGGLCMDCADMLGVSEMFIQG